MALQRRIDELERQVGTRKLPEAFSVEAEERRQEARGKERRKRKRSRGRRTTTAEKVAQAVRIEKVYPQGVPQDDCRLSHTRPVWRLEDGRAVLVAYEIRRWSGTGRSCFARWAEKPGLTGRGLRDDGRPSLLDRVIPVPDG